MTTGNAMADIRAMFTKQFPQLTKGKDRSEVKEIMKEMGYGMNTGLNKTMRKSGGKSNFKDGGDVSMPKRRPKNFKKTVEKQKKERAVAKGKVTVGGLNEMTDYDKEQFLKSKKMKLGGEATSNPPSKKKLTDKARDIIEKDKSENKMSSFSKVADMLTKQGFTGAAGEKGKVSATERRKKLNRDIFKGGQSKQVPQGMRVGGEAKPLVGNQFKLDKNKNGRIDGGDFAKMEMGGKVKEYGGGGKVKGGKMSCRGMGAAIKGGGFSIS